MPNPLQSAAAESSLCVCTGMCVFACKFGRPAVAHAGGYLCEDSVYADWCFYWPRSEGD